MTLVNNQRGDVVPSQSKWTGTPVNTGIVPPGRAVIAPADPETETENTEADTDTEGLYNTPLDPAGLGKQPIGKSFLILGGAALVGFYLLRKKKKTTRRKPARRK